MSAQDDRVPGDELIRRYHEASAQDMRRPGAHVRQAVQQHAQAVLAAQNRTAPTPPDTQREAANQPRWKLAMLASIVLAGLTGLLVLQFDRGTPEEKDIAFGQPLPPPVSTRATAEAPPPTTTPAAPAGRTATLTDSAGAGNTTKAAQKETATPGMGQPSPEAMPAPVAPPRPDADKTAAPPAFSASPALPGSPEKESRATARMADSAAADPPASTGTLMARPTPPKAAMQAAPATPAPPAQRSRDEPSEPLEPAAAMLEAARNGRLTELERLLQQGVSINAPDDTGKTALILATIHGHAAVVQRLLALGANRALTDRDGLNALQHARRLGREQIAALLEAGFQ